MLAAIALIVAPGVIRLSPVDFRTEFVHPVWWNVGWLLVLPVFVAARACPKLAWLVGLCAGVPQFVVAAVVVGRYQDSGWGDGLEYLTYLQAAVMTVVFLVAALVGYLFRRRAS